MSLKRVKCVDADKSAGALQHGAIYEVAEIVENYTKPGDTRYVLVGQSEFRKHWATRFVDVKDDEVSTPTSDTNAAITAVASSSTTVVSDPEEDRLWRLMRPHVPEGECICGGPKDRCPYHKDI